jgi:hypothetical protein
MTDPEEKPNLGDNIQPAGKGRQREDGKTGRRAKLTQRVIAREGA